MIVLNGAGVPTPEHDLDGGSGIAYDTIMGPLEIVIDTIVFVSALRSRRGASFLLLSLLDSEKLSVNLSVPLVLEYEEVGKRMLASIALDESDLDAVLDYFCRIARHRPIHYLWRPFLQDPSDDMVLELAVAAGGTCIVTYNKADFLGAEQLGVRVLTPRELLVEIGELP